MGDNIEHAAGTEVNIAFFAYAPRNVIVREDLAVEEFHDLANRLHRVSGRRVISNDDVIAPLATRLYRIVVYFRKYKKKLNKIFCEALHLSILDKYKMLERNI
jgi:hypothetical protein